MATTPRTTSTQPQHSSPHYILTLIRTVSTHHQSTPHHIHTFISKVSTHQHHNTPHHIHSIYPPYTQYPHIHATTPHTESTHPCTQYCIHTSTSQLLIPNHTSIYKVFTLHSSTYHIHTSVYTVSTRMYTLQLPVMYPHIHTANHAPMPMTVCTLACGKMNLQDICTSMGCAYCTYIKLKN
jgi:hypothetical protein